MLNTTIGEIVRRLTDDDLIRLVMALTGGAANPATVKAQIERIRLEHQC